MVMELGKVVEETKFNNLSGLFQDQVTPVRYWPM